MHDEVFSEEPARRVARHEDDPVDTWAPSQCLADTGLDPHLGAGEGSEPAHRGICVWGGGLTLGGSRTATTPPSGTEARRESNRCSITSSALPCTKRALCSRPLSAALCLASRTASEDHSTPTSCATPSCSATPNPIVPVPQQTSSSLPQLVLQTLNVSKS